MDILHKKHDMTYAYFRLCAYTEFYASGPRYLSPDHTKLSQWPSADPGLASGRCVFFLVLLDPVQCLSHHNTWPQPSHRQGPHLGPPLCIRTGSKVWRIRVDWCATPWTTWKNINIEALCIASRTLGSSSLPISLLASVTILWNRPNDLIHLC